jgi:hypothetical protein
VIWLFGFGKISFGFGFGDDDLAIGVGEERGRVGFFWGFDRGAPV